MSSSLLSHRRRSSMALSVFHPVKAGVYGINTSSPRNVTFAPNVTPVTYVEEPEDDTATPEDESSMPRLFPPSDEPPIQPTRRRIPPGKRRGSSYIPRPPNAFMLFRADFVRQKHVPGSIETNHGSLSKIIGNCWRNLPLEEKRVWEIRAKEEKKQHKIKYPNYRFRPVHNKNKPKKKDKALPTAQDEAHCEVVTQLLLEGNKGEQLAARLRDMNIPFAAASALAMPAPLHYGHRRSSSVPLPESFFPQNTIAIPSIPFDFHFSSSRPDSPHAGISTNFGFSGPRYSISQQNRMLLGQRRASSAGPLGKPYQQMQGYNNMHFDSTITGWGTGWGVGGGGFGSFAPSETNGSELDLPPQTDTSFFPINFSLSGHQDGEQQQHQQHFGGGDMMGMGSGMDGMGPMDGMGGPMAYSAIDTIGPHDVSANLSLNASCYPFPDASATSKFPSPSVHRQYQQTPPAWPADFMAAQSEPSSVYSGSPAASDDVPPHVVVHAPQPHHVSGQRVPSAEMWGDVSHSQQYPIQHELQYPEGALDGMIPSEAQRHMDGLVDDIFDEMAPHVGVSFHQQNPPQHQQFGAGFDELQVTF